MNLPPASAASGPITPERLQRYVWSFGVARALEAALKLRLFSRLAQGQNTVAALAEAGLSRRGVRPLLDVLVALELVQRKGAGETATHRLAPDAGMFLVEGKPSYLGDFFLFHMDRVAEDWAGLADSVASGRPVTSVDRPEEGAALWDALVDSLFPANFSAAQVAGRELARRHSEGALRILDVASGSGVWGIGCALVEPRATVTAFDLASTLPHTRTHVARHDLEARFTFREGDLREADLGTRCFEAILLGHICHSEGREHSRALFRKCAQALVPGGTLVIAEFLPDAARTGPLIPLLFALNMLVHTTEGDTFSFEEYRGWLEGAGFRDVRTLEAPAPSPLILATR